jgi:hypothetical protein
MASLVHAICLFPVLKEALFDVDCPESFASYIYLFLLIYGNALVWPYGGFNPLTS